MAEFNDVFISYGRRHSKEFSIRLHNDLVAKGYSVWFDQNDIPLGVDFQTQIDTGIEGAHNFCFVISPHAVQSEYCRKELDLAKKLKKRIIPILHVELTENWELLDGLIAKLNWIYAREGLDDYDKTLNGLCSLVELERDYVQKHTRILTQALEWDRKNRNQTFLLVGTERQEAENWLLQKFSSIQAPTLPTRLQAEFLTESKKNANNLQTDVFISYDREDAGFRDWISHGLAYQNITCWTDTGDIKTGDDFEEAIKEGIERADNFLYVISPKSICSAYCIIELEYALKLDKRILTVLSEETPDSTIPESVRSLQYLDFSKGDEVHKLEELNKLLSYIEADYDHFYKSKVFLVQALKWEKQRENKSILLRGFNLESAQTWLKLANQRKKHRALPLHQRFIEASTIQTVDLTTEVFLSYSRKDSDFSRNLNERLQLSGKTTWFDQESIAAGTDFAAEIYKGIDNSENFVFVISPDSVLSPFCKDEVEYAHKQGKRFITVLYKPIDEGSLHPELASVQWIDFRQSGSRFNASFSELIRTLDTDREHVQNHTKWQILALEWMAKNQTKDLLLRGSAFSVADLWMGDAFVQKKVPKPTVQQKLFLDESRAAILFDEKRKKRSVLILRFLLILSLLGLGVAVFAGLRAFQSKNEATRQAEIAQLNATKAEAAARQALAEKQKADAARKLADNARKAAEVEKVIAENERQKADKQRALALSKEKEARIASAEALKQKALAEANLQQAKLAQEKERLAYNAAQFHLYVFNGKELANKALTLSQNDTLRALLAKEAFELTAFGYKHFSPREIEPFEFDPEILEAIQNALLGFETNNLSNNAILALSGGQSAFVFCDARNLLTMATMDASGSPIRLKVVKRGNLPTPLVRSVRVDVQNVKAVATSVDGSVFLGSSDLVFDKVYQHIGSVVASCFIPENKWLVTAGGEGKVVIYDWSAKKNVRVFQLASVSKEIRYAGSYLYIIDVDGRLWRLDYRSDGATAEEIGSKGLRYQSLAVASKHEWLLVGTNNGKVLVFNTNDVKAKAAELTRKHTGVVSSVAVSWDENFLTTASLDGTVFFWDLRQNAKLTGLAPVNMQYPDNMPNRKVFNVEFLGSDYILMGDNAHLRLGIINIQKAYDRLNSLLKQQRLPDELWKYYIKGNLTRP